MPRPVRYEDLPAAMTKEQKAAYALSRGQTRQHHCHWPGCGRQVPPARWGCRDHWFRLPKRLRDRVWSCYRPGQEEDCRPSAEYLQVAREIQTWIKENYPDAEVQEGAG